MKNNSKLNEKDINSFLEEINFFFLEAINISFPPTIKILIDEVLEMETAGRRISGSKKILKEKIETVLNELQGVLNELSNNISPLLEKYKEGWSFGFDVPKEIESFKDLLIAKTDFFIKDNSQHKTLHSKGSGLQRLSHILMHFRILDKLRKNNDSWIIAIDEPDVYLHFGLQKKLLSDIKENAKDGQFFITTHSPIFIDSSTFTNVNLLEQKVEEKSFKRKNGNVYNCISTQLVNISDSIGMKKIRDYLGIECNDFMIFDNFNIIVEGQCDKVYIEKILEIHNIDKPYIHSCDGADNIKSYLEFCDSFAPKNALFRVILDNDEKGREQYNKISNKKFKLIKVECIFVDMSNGKDNKNIEIEDLIPIRIICNGINTILSKNKLYKTFSNKQILEIESKIKCNAFADKGILCLLENEKNNINPNNGNNIKIDGINVKKSLAQYFENLNKDEINLVLHSEKIHNFINKIISG
ncbi:ATP-dependent nuclease [Campylobacter jejuni]|uniref:ATP-dependent nuclease n=2 Tax=Campylobacteraceae TaxID=72294 RepID=UPI003A599CEF